MTEPGSIVESAAGAAKAVLSQTPAPTSACCTAGAEAFAESQAELAAEYAIAFGELAEAQAVLGAEAEASLDGWIAAEAAIQRSVGNKNFATIVTDLVLAESNVTESAFNSSEAALAAEISHAEWAFGQAEAFLHAESLTFSREAGCTPTPGATVSPVAINSPAMTGPQTIVLPAGKLVAVDATAQSSGTQTVVIKDPNNTVVFTASGASSTGGTLTTIGQGAFTAAGGIYTIELTANAGILASAMATNYQGDSYLTTYTFATNDGGATAGDRDFNDLVVTLEVFRSAG